MPKRGRGYGLRIDPTETALAEAQRRLEKPITPEQQAYYDARHVALRSPEYQALAKQIDILTSGPETPEAKAQFELLSQQQRAIVSRATESLPYDPTGVRWHSEKAPTEASIHPEEAPPLSASELASKGPDPLLQQPEVSPAAVEKYKNFIAQDRRDAAEYLRKADLAERAGKPEKAAHYRKTAADYIKGSEVYEELVRPETEQERGLRLAAMPEAERRREEARIIKEHMETPSPAEHNYADMLDRSIVRHERLAKELREAEDAEDYSRATDLRGDLRVENDRISHYQEKLHEEAQLSIKPEGKLQKEWQAAQAEVAPAWAASGAADRARHEADAVYQQAAKEHAQKQTQESSDKLNEAYGAVVEAAAEQRKQQERFDKTIQRRDAAVKAIRDIQTGARGGKFYISPTGQKVYVKPNPGVEITGTVEPTPFISGLPQSVHMNQPQAPAQVGRMPMMFGNRPR